MKSFKQVLTENIFFGADIEPQGPIDLDEELKGFNKVMVEDGTVGYVNEKMGVPMKHEHLHEWVMASGYRYQTKAYRPGVVTEHTYIKHSQLQEHHLIIITKGDQRDVWQVAHHTVEI